MLKPDKTLNEVMSFMLGAKSIDGTVMEKRISSLCAEAFGNANITSEELN